MVPLEGHGNDRCNRVGELLRQIIVLIGRGTKRGMPRGLFRLEEAAHLEVTPTQRVKHPWHLCDTQGMTIRISSLQWRCGKERLDSC